MQTLKQKLAVLRRALARRDAEVQRLKDKLAETRDELRRAKRIAKTLVLEEP